MPQGYLVYFAQTFTAMAPYEGAHRSAAPEARTVHTSRRRRARRTAGFLRRSLAVRATHA